jgi:hypothetical protein
MRLNIFLLLVGCEAFKNTTEGIVDSGGPVADVDTDTDTDVDTDTDTDTDSEGDLDVDNDGDGYTENQGDCDDSNPNVNPGVIEDNTNGIDDDCDGVIDNPIDCDATPPTASNLPDLECATTFIQEGTPILGSTYYGLNYFNKDHYAGDSEWYCLPFLRGDYFSSERVFLFTHPGNDQYCDVFLESPCADLDLFALRYNPYSSGGCPDPNTLNIQCEASADAGPFDESINSLYENSQTMYMLIVDSPNPTDAWFRLNVECN